MKFRLFIKDTSFYKTVAVISIPIILQQIINIGLNLTDTVMLGSFGEAQLSASSLANQYYFIFGILCMGIGSGSAVLTAQYWGKQDLISIKKVMSLTIRICLTIGIIFTVITKLFPVQIMSVYTNDPAVIAAGVKYLNILSYVFLFHGLALVTVLVVRTMGIVKLALVASCCSFGLHILFNWMFIFGKLGAPRLEIGGAAVGTLLARICEFAIVFGYLLIFEKKVRFKIRDFFAPCKDMLAKFMHIATPVIISDFIMVMGNNALAAILGRMGSSMVAANAITTVTVQLSTVFIMGMSSASAVIVGNTVGRQEYDKAKQQGITFVAMSFLIGLLGSFLIWAINPLIISFYNIEPKTYLIAKQLMNAVAFIIIFQSMSSVITKGVLRGGGDTKFLMIADVLFLWIASLPLGYFAAFTWGFSAGIVYVFLKIDMIIKSIWCIWRLMGDKWIKPVENIGNRKKQLQE